MARNEAAGLGADTIRPLGDPHDGAQTWGAYTCGDVVRVPVRRDGTTPPPPPGQAVETYPVKDH
jgi:hypothetical protein